MQRKKNETVQYNGITEGVIWQQLLIFFFPILFGTFFQQLYNTADAMIVGKFVGKEALSAVGGTTGNLINLLVGFFVGLSSGAAVIVSQHYGARQDDQVRTSVHTSFCLALAGGVFLMIVGEACARVAVKAMGAPEEIMDYSVTYMRIYFLGVIPNLVYNMGAAILRAVGDSKRPLYYLIVCCFVNIGLDLLFVVVLKMEVAKPMLRKIIQIGFPAGLQSVLYSISNVVIQANINSFGTNVIAAWAVYGKVDGLFWMIMDAMGIAITTFAGQNFGARKYERMQKGHYVGLGITTILTAILAAGVMLFGSILGSLFTSDPDVLAESMTIIRFVTPFWFSYICVNVFSSTLRGIGDTFIPMLLICFGTCGLRVLWIFTAGVMYPGLYTSLASYPLSWTVTSVAFIIYYYKFSDMRRINKLIKKEKKERQ